MASSRFLPVLSRLEPLTRFPDELHHFCGRIIHQHRGELLELSQHSNGGIITTANISLGKPV